MRYERYEPRPHQGPSHQHPDAADNYKFATKLVKAKDFDPEESTILKKTVTVVFQGADKDHYGHYSDPLSVSFYWKAKQANFGCSISFHQPSEEFQQKINRFFFNPNQQPKPMPKTQYMEGD